MPGDKSISHRAIILGAISEGKTSIKGFLQAEDCLNTMKIFQNLGVQINPVSEIELSIQGRGLYGLSKPRVILDAGNSATTMRLLLGVLAGQDFKSTITGDKSLCNRPMKRIIAPLRQMGAKIEARDDNFAPINIRGGKLRGIDYVCEVASAQVKSCVLLAGLYAEGKTVFTESIKSRDHTERMLEYLESNINIKDLTVSITCSQRLKAKPITVPGDISSAAFFIVAGILLKDSQIQIKDVGLNPTRVGILNVLKDMGASIILESKTTKCNEPIGDIIIKYNRLKGVRITKDMIPFLIDEIPIIAVAATQSEGITEITGAKELRVKETDRIKAISSQLSILGAKIEEKEDGMIIYGPVRLKGNKVQSFGDHRMAMALAIAGLVAEGTTRVIDTECINTSFPGFIQVLKEISCGN